MTRAAYLRLAVLFVVLSIALTLFGRRPRHIQSLAPAPPPAPIDTLTLVFGDESVTPPAVQGTLHHRLALTLIATGTHATRVSLSGYEHTFAERLLSPGSTTRDTVVLELPGEDFAWMVGGKPAGRLRVAGSHLVEGHR